MSTWYDRAVCKGSEYDPFGDTRQMALFILAYCTHCPVRRARGTGLQAEEGGMSFIVIEGPDGVGKSTLVAAFGRRGWPTFKFPRSPRPSAGPYRVEAMLDDMASAREELLAAGPVVVDRYDMSTLVHQGLLRGVDGSSRLNEKAAQYVLGRMRRSRRPVARPGLYVVLLGPRLRRDTDAMSEEDRQPVRVQRTAYEQAVELMDRELGCRCLMLHRSARWSDVEFIEQWLRGGVRQKEGTR